MCGADAILRCTVKHAYIVITTLVTPKGALRLTMCKASATRKGL